jgi:hypothetical protein
VQNSNFLLHFDAVPGSGKENDAAHSPDPAPQQKNN